MHDLEQYLGQIEFINSQGAESLKNVAVEVARFTGVSNILNNVPPAPKGNEWKKQEIKERITGEDWEV